MEYKADYQTQTRGTNDEEYQIYLSCADDGKGGDITRNGEPLLTYEEWLKKQLDKINKIAYNTLYANIVKHGCLTFREIQA